MSAWLVLACAACIAINVVCLVVIGWTVFKAWGGDSRAFAQTCGSLVGMLAVWAAWLAVEIARRT